MTRPAPLRFDPLGIAIMIASIISFAVTPTLNRLAYDAGSDAASLTTVRFVVAVPVLGLVVLALRRPFRLTAHAWRHSAVVGILMAVTAFGYVAAVGYIPVSLASLTFFTFPLICGIAATVLNREPLSPLRGTLFIAAFIGLMLALGVSFETLAPAGIAFALMGAVFAASAVVWSSRTLHSYDSTVCTFHMMVAACLLAIAVHAVVGPMKLPQTALGWFGFLGNAIFYALGLIGFFAGIARIGAIPTAMISNIEPIISILLAVSVLGDRLVAVQWLGVFMVIASAAIMTESDRRRPAAT
ncbi:MAG: DMT family transporter [Alphaproteobacteria bacterium]|nr:DMT family transporter [Alphaproteobacteria bacterium]